MAINRQNINSKKYIYPANEIIFTCYYNRNETETVVAGQLKQASSKIIRG